MATKISTKNVKYREESILKQVIYWVLQTKNETVSSIGVNRAATGLTNGDLILSSLTRHARCS